MEHLIKNQKGAVLSLTLNRPKLFKNPILQESKEANYESSTIRATRRTGSAENDRA